MKPRVCLGEHFLSMTTQASKEEFTVSFGYEPKRFVIASMLQNRVKMQKIVHYTQLF